MTRSSRVLVLNSGSSSLKFRLLDAAAGGQRAILDGIVTRIGGEAIARLRPRGGAVEETRIAVADHAAAAGWVIERLGAEFGEPAIEAVGHRVVHGGERFAAAARIDDQVMSAIAALSDLAPLHQPACLAVIATARAALPATPMVAVFDTAFHRAMPAAAAHYAIPRPLAARHALRRYGFHGIAHASLMAGYARAAGSAAASARLVTLHLGSGCSAAAIRAGRSIDTSMGLTPLEGLVMGTRSGDLDPSVVGALVRAEGWSAAEVERLLNERSGLLGLSGVSADMRQVLAAEARGEADAALAVEMFCYRARKYVGAYLAALGGADAVVFGGGIGERSAAIRRRICAGLECFGLRLDEVANVAAVATAPGGAARISAGGSRLAAWVVGVDEEAEIAAETVRCLGRC